MQDRDTEERAILTQYGMNWDWLSKTGKRIGFRVSRMARISSGSLLRVTTYDDINDAPRLDVYLSRGGRSFRVWLNDEEITPR